MAAAQSLAPNDWLEHPELLPPRPLTLTEVKYTRYFATDIQGRKCHDQYVFLAPNGVAVIGIAPSHPLIATHRRVTGYQPLELKYIPPRLEHLQADELVAVTQDDDAPEDAMGARAPGAPEVPSGPQDASQVEAEDPLASSSAVEQQGEAGAQAAEPSTNPSSGRSAGEGQGPPAASRPEQPAIEPFGPAECARINFDSGSGRNLAGTKVSGKKRTRSGQLRGTAVLAAVERQGGGPSFPLLTLLNGHLLEINERLAKTPGLLFERPCREGYLALLKPSPEALAYMRSRLLPEPDYLRLRGLSAEDLL